MSIKVGLAYLIELLEHDWRPDVECVTHVVDSQEVSDEDVPIVPLQSREDFLDDTVVNLDMGAERC